MKGQMNALGLQAYIYIYISLCLSLSIYSTYLKGRTSLDRRDFGLLGSRLPGFRTRVHPPCLVAAGQIRPASTVHHRSYGHNSQDM